MLTFMVDDVEVVDAVFQRHNNWIRDYCSHAPERLIGVGCLSLRDIDMAIAELKRCAQMGIKGVAIPCTAPVDKPYSDPFYEPFWDGRGGHRAAAHDAHLLRLRARHEPA